MLKRIPVRRHTCLEDYAHQDWDKMLLWNPENCSRPGATYEPSLENRMGVFSDIAHTRIKRAFADDVVAPDYVVQVSCTGYDSPNAAQRIVADKEWYEKTQVLHVGHMGCYAALPSTAMASNMVPECARRASDGTAKASLFLIELCTLHLRPLAMNPAVIVQQALFSDGAVRLDVTSDYKPGSLAILDTFEAVLPNSLNEMTWRPANFAFDMTLSVDVPQLIQDRLTSLVQSVLQRNGLSFDDIRYFAVHPGGPKIISAVEEILKLSPEAVAHSYQIFSQHGNMSSTTMPHIWHAMANDDSVPDGALIISLAFGPGLTVAGNLLRKGK